jgi:branched-chain amino acid transport system ATP-binding protein
MLRTRGLTKAFGGLTAVDSVDFELGSELTSLIGPNGAGKTTFFNLLTGVLSPTAGSVELRADDGWDDITDAPPHETARRGVHRSYQVTNVFPNSTVLENVRVAEQAAGTDARNAWRNVDHFEEHTERAYRKLDRVGLTDRADDDASTLSHGAKRKLEVAVALAHGARIPAGPGAASQRTAELRALAAHAEPAGLVAAHQVHDDPVESRRLPADNAVHRSRLGSLGLNRRPLPGIKVRPKISIPIFQPGRRPGSRGPRTEGAWSGDPAPAAPWRPQTGAREAQASMT